MPWLQLTLHTNPDNTQHIADLLSDAGASAVTLHDAADQPLYEPPPGETPLWSDTLVTGMFEAATNIENVITFITESVGNCPRWQLNPLEDKDWVREWMRHFKPMQFGKRVWIVPSHHTPADENAVNIMLDPGLAFGTGTHPTTAMCLTYLDQYPPINRQVIDYGCGSGILAVAAAMLGATQVLAIDNDPQALQATHENAQKNQVTEQLSIALPNMDDHSQTELLIANILARPILDLAEYFSSRLNSGSKIVLSGILARQADEILTHYQTWFDIQPCQQIEDWICLSGIKC